MTTMIRIDTAELTQAAETLRAAAVEAADIGAGLWSCAQCPMPAAVQGLVDKIVVTADQVLDAAAAQLGAQAVDLLNRAIIAQHDSLTAAGVATPAAAPALVGGHGTFSDAVHVEPSGFNAGLIGGGHYSNSVSVSVGPVLGGPSAGSIGGGHYSNSVNASTRPWPVNAGFPGGNLTLADAVFNGGNATRHILAPSRRSLEDKAGGILSRSEVRSRSPFTLY